MIIRGEHARVYAKGFYGEVDPPSFAYELFKGELWKRARSSGLRRYGKQSGGDDDSRPVGLAYQLVWAGGAWTTQTGGVDLVPVENSFYGDNPAWRQADATANAAKSYRSSFAVPRNTGHSIRAYIAEPPKAQALKLTQWRWGVVGAGCVFQIRDGKPEIGLMSIDFNAGDLANLHLLWATAQPSLAQQTEIDRLIAVLFDKFESLSFENSTSKSDWYNNLWTVSFIPEERGVLHVVLEGGDAVTVESEAILETRKAGVLWEGGALSLLSGGGAFYFQTGYPWFNEKSLLDFGPFKENFFFSGSITGYATHTVSSLGDLTFSRNAYYEEGQSEVTFEEIYYGNDTQFGFRATMIAINRRRTPWLYGLSARLAPGPRNGGTAITWDSDKPYQPLSGPKLTCPAVLDIVPSCDGVAGKRTCKVTLWDFNGAMTAAQGVPHDKIATVEIAGAPILTNGLIVSASQSDMKSLALQASGIFSEGPGTELTLEIADGWAILAETDCDPSPIGDGLALGAQLRAILSLAGFNVAEMAGVSAADGKRLPRAPLGENWAVQCDCETKCADAIRDLMQSYGFGWRIYCDRAGVWQFKRPSTAIQGVFDSTGAGISAHAEPGRLKILKPIDLTHDYSELSNDFIVIGGKNGEIVRHLPGSRALTGRRKTKKIKNSGLVSGDDVQYALLSLQWDCGRVGRRAQFTTFFHKRFDPGDRITCDGSTWEIEAMSGGSWAKDEAQYNVLEILGTNVAPPIVIDGGEPPEDEG